jgi:LmbE family N-acetylglucosaminyl deacetylase
MTSFLRRQLQSRQLRQLDRQLTPVDDRWLTQSTLIFAPHQDDETLGCGGTSLKKRQLAVSVGIAFLTDGRHSHRGLMDPDELQKIRRNEAIAAARQLQVAPESVTFFDFPDGDLADHRSEAIDRVVGLLEATQPQQVFIPYYREPMMVIDHLHTHEVVIAALKRVQFQGEILEYPIWYWAQYPWVSLRENTGTPLRNLKNSLKTLNRTLRSMPNPWKDFQVRVDILAELPQKRAALDEHRSQMTQFTDDPNWFTLDQVHDGDWIKRSLQPYEIFYSHPIHHPIH